MKLCLTSLKAFCKMTSSVDAEKTADLVSCLLQGFLHCVLKYSYRQTEEGLDKIAMMQTETWLNCLAHMVCDQCIKRRWRPGTDAVTSEVSTSISIV